MFWFPPHPTSAFALPGEIRANIIRDKMNVKTSINSIYPTLSASAASLAAVCLPDKVQECLQSQEATDRAWFGL